MAGTLIVAGEGSAVVYATGMRTEFGRVAHLTQTADETESPLQKEIRRVSHLVALLALRLGVASFFIDQAIGLPFWANFMFAIGIIVLSQMANLFAGRHPRLPAWRFPLLSNPLLLAGLATELGLLLASIYTPWGNRLFGTAPPGSEVWLFALPFALLLAAEEVRKALVRRWCSA